MKPYKCSDTMDINEIISTFDNHVSIKKIKEYFPDNASTQILSTQRFLKMKLKKKCYIQMLKSHQQLALFQQQI